MNMLLFKVAKIRSERGLKEIHISNLWNHRHKSLMIISERSSCYITQPMLAAISGRGRDIETARMFVVERSKVAVNFTKMIKQA